ncbi:MAG: hypothetical protein ABIH34_02000 [Nanoarchaeota archaeon]
MLDAKFHLFVAEDSLDCAGLANDAQRMGYPLLNESGSSHYALTLFKTLQERDDNAGEILMTGTPWKDVPYLHVTGEEGDLTQFLDLEFLKGIVKNEPPRYRQPFLNLVSASDEESKIHLNEIKPVVWLDKHGLHLFHHKVIRDFLSLYAIDRKLTTCSVLEDV